MNVPALIIKLDQLRDNPKYRVLCAVCSGQGQLRIPNTNNIAPCGSCMAKGTIGWDQGEYDKDRIALIEKFLIPKKKGNERIMTGYDIQTFRQLGQKTKENSMLLEIHGDRLELLYKDNKHTLGHFKDVNDALMFLQGYEWGLVYQRDKGE